MVQMEKAKSKKISTSLNNEVKTLISQIIDTKVSESQISRSHCDFYSGTAAFPVCVEFLAYFCFFSISFGI